MSYVSGNTIRELREKNMYTQKQLAEILHISDKTVSKWETGRGLPDIGILAELAAALRISIAELLTGEYVENRNRSANIRKMSYYVCPICQNVIQAIGRGSYSCCGILLPELDAEEMDDEHKIQVEIIDNEYYISLQHEMSKNHYISFLAYVTSNSSEMIKLYPEQSAEGRFAKHGHGSIYAFCNKHGLYKISV